MVQIHLIIDITAALVDKTREHKPDNGTAMVVEKTVEIKPDDGTAMVAEKTLKSDDGTAMVAEKTVEIKPDDGTTMVEKTVDIKSDDVEKPEASGIIAKNKEDQHRVNGEDVVGTESGEGLENRNSSEYRWEPDCDEFDSEESDSEESDADYETDVEIPLANGFSDADDRSTEQGSPTETESVEVDTRTVPIDIFTLPENLPITVWYSRFSDFNGSDQVRFFIQDSKCSKEVFVFDGRFTENMVDSIIDFFILNCKHPLEIVQELEYLLAYSNYVDGKGKKPNKAGYHCRDEGDELIVTLREKSRTVGHFKPLLRGLGSGLNIFRNDQNEIEIRKRTEADEVERFPCNMNELLIIFKKLCRYHIQLSKNFEMGSFGGNAIQYALNRMRHAEACICKLQNVHERDVYAFVKKAYREEFKNYKFDTEDNGEPDCKRTKLSKD
jgi:hypothetical protein